MPAPNEIAHLVRWFWIPEWDIEPGRTSRQQVLAYPASNLVIQEDGAELVGPTTRLSYRDLAGDERAECGTSSPLGGPGFRRLQVAAEAVRQIPTLISRRLPPTSATPTTHISPAIFGRSSVLLPASIGASRWSRRPPLRLRRRPPIR